MTKKEEKEEMRVTLELHLQKLARDGLRSEGGGIYKIFGGLKMIN